MDNSPRIASVKLTRFPETPGSGSGHVGLARREPLGHLVRIGVAPDGHLP